MNREMLTTIYHNPENYNGFTRWTYECANCRRDTTVYLEQAVNPDGKRVYCAWCGVPMQVTVSPLTPFYSGRD